MVSILIKNATIDKFSQSVMYHTGYKIREIWLLKKSCTFSGPDSLLCQFPIIKNVVCLGGGGGGIASLSIGCLV